MFECFAFQADLVNVLFRLEFVSIPLALRGRAKYLVALRSRPIALESGEGSHKYETLCLLGIIQRGQLAGKSFYNELYARRN